MGRLGVKGLSRIVARYRVGDYVDEVDHAVKLTLTKPEANWLRKLLDEDYPEAKDLNARIATPGTHLNNPHDACFIAGGLSRMYHRSRSEMGGVGQRVAFQLCHVAEHVISAEEGRKVKLIR